MNNKCRVFFRDDDVYTIDKQFLDFFHLLLENGIPAIYAVIPGKATTELLEFLKEQKRKNPSLIDIVQHGWMHKNYGSGTTDKYEFGKSRTYDEQKKDIISGMIKLYTILENAFTPAFIPPYHGFDFNTISILKKLGYPIFSARNSNIKPTNTIVIPTSLSLTVYNKRDAATMLTYNETRQLIFKEIARNSPIITILAHHKDYNKMKFSELKKTVTLLKQLKDLGKIDFSLFSDLMHMKNIRFPTVDLTLEITNRCNLRCKTCSIWQEKKEAAISLDALDNIFNTLSHRVNLGYISLTGGEPFLHPQIDKIFRYFCYKNSAGIGIYTNGYDTGRIIKFLKRNISYLGGLTIGISLDGIGSIHNILRGKNNAYEKTLVTIQKIRTYFPGVMTEIKFTISPSNYKSLKPLFVFCKNNGCFFSPKFVENRANYYYNRSSKSNISFESFNPVQKKQILRTLEMISKQQEINEAIIIDSKVIKTLINFCKNGWEGLDYCITPLKDLFITSSGNIHPCLYKNPIGNIYQPSKKWAILEEHHRGLIKEGFSGKCPKCIAYHGYLKNINL